MAAEERTDAVLTGSDQISLECSTEYVSYPLTEQTCWAVTSFKAPFHETTSRASVDIVAVIDKSGSMKGEKINLVRKTLLFVIDQLKDCDRMSLVTYDSFVTINFSLMKMDKPNKGRAKAFVELIKEGSCTNLSGGLLKGMEQVALTSGDDEKAKVQSVLLLTDGLANEGITGTANILNVIKKFQEEGQGAMETYAPVAPPPPPGGRRRQQRVVRNIRQFRPPSGPPPQRPVQQQAPQMPVQQQAPQMPVQQQAPQMPVQQQAPQMPVQQQAPQMPVQQQAPQMPVQQQAPQMQAPQMPVQQQAPQMPVQQQAPQMQMQQAPQMPVQQQAPLSMPKLDVNEEEEAMEVDESEPKPKPSGPKFEGTIYTFGFGSDHDATLLEAISTQGGGVYYYIDTNEKIPESFADCLGGLLSVVGQNLSLKLELQGGNSVAQVHANRAINWTTPNKTCDIAMGDLQSEEERDIVMELKLPTLPSPQQDLAIKASLSYFNVITSALDTVTFDLNIDRKDGAQGPAKETVDVQRNRIIATSALKKAEPLADQGKLEEARTILKDAIQQLEESASAQQDFCKALISDLKKSLESMRSREEYRGHGKLYMHSKAQAHSVQRSNFVDDTSYYQTSSKKAMRSKAKW